MKKNFKKWFFISIIAIILLIQGVSVASAQVPRLTSEEAGGLSDATLLDIVTQLMQNIIVTTGLIAVIGFSIASLYYFLSAGDEDALKRAKRAMVYSIVGVVVSLSAFVIIQAVDRILNANSFFF